MPLVIYLHQWGWDWAESRNSLAPQTKAKNWNYIHPDFRGKNNHLKSCGSDYVISDIDEAIDWTLKKFNVDTTRIYVVGASGGGYAALCSFMKSRHKVKEYLVWVPITDLKRWYFECQTRTAGFAKDIVHCTCGDCNEPDMEEAVKRSPLYWKTPVQKLKDCKLKIYAGINDGYTGSVPIIHSINFYNKMVKDSGGSEKDQISFEDASWLLTTRTSPVKTQHKIGDRDILYEKVFNNVTLSIFDGKHEILVDYVLPE